MHRNSFGEVVDHGIDQEFKDKTRFRLEGAIALKQGRPVINEQVCTGCGVCQYVCPAPYNAIAIMPIAGRYEEADEEAPEVEFQGHNWRQEYFGNRSLKPEANVDPSPLPKDRA